MSLRTPQTRLIDITAAAEQLGVTVRYVRRLVSERRIPYIKLGHYLRFDPAELETWIDRARVSEANPGRSGSTRSAWPPPSVAS